MRIRFSETDPSQADLLQMEEMRKMHWNMWDNAHLMKRHLISPQPNHDEFLLNSQHGQSFCKQSSLDAHLKGCLEAANNILIIPTNSELMSAIP